MLKASLGFPTTILTALRSDGVREGEHEMANDGQLQEVVRRSVDPNAAIEVLPSEGNGVSMSAPIILPLAPRKPERMNIQGEEKSLVSLLEEFAGHWEFTESNCVQYRDIWKRFLPRFQYGANDQQTLLNPDHCVAYDPIVAVRRCYPTSEKSIGISDLPYFIVILNTARDQRPRQENVSSGLQGPDPLQKHLIDKDMIIAEFGDFWLCPNGYPYHRFASLLVAKNPDRKQVYPTPDEISTWMRFSILTKQFVFFNSEHAGASIPQRMHAQVVDPAGIRSEDKEVTYPLLNDKIVRRRSIRKGIDLLDGYGIEALGFRGRDAPHYASLAITKLRDEQGHWYNMMIRQKEVFVVARNAENETSHCIGKKVGAYEMSGVILVGNIEEPLLAKLDLDRVVSGAEIFSQLNYEQISSNIGNATAGLGDLAHKL
jgi:hypothetical protein